MAQAHPAGRNRRAPHCNAPSSKESPESANKLSRSCCTANPPLRVPAFNRCDAREWLCQRSRAAIVSRASRTSIASIFLPLPARPLLLRVLKALQDRPAGDFVARGLVRKIACAQWQARASILPDLAFRLTAIRFADPAPARAPRRYRASRRLFLERICARYHLPRLVLRPAPLARLLQHDWPGNVRELSSVLESAVLEAANGLIRAEDLRDRAIRARPCAPARPSASPRDPRPRRRHPSTTSIPGSRS